MSLALTCSYTAIVVNLSVSFLATGGTPAYVYTVVAGGAGGTIDPTTGIYTAPASINSQNPAALFDTIMVTDSLLATATRQIFIGNPLLLFCDIIQKEMGLSQGRVYLFDQKIFQPTDSGLYVAVSVPSCKPFSNVTKPATIANALDWSQAEQTVNMLATVDIDIISRGPEARDRKEEVILALNSIYAQSQQEANSFYIGKLPPGSRFLNLSNIDGAAIPYRYKISVNLQYAVTKTKAVPYFDTFQSASVTTDP